MKNQLIEKIKQHTIKFPNAGDGGEFVCDIYDIEGNNISTNEMLLSTTVVDEDGKLTIHGNEYATGKHVSIAPEDLNENVLEDILSGLVANKDTKYKNAVVRQRTREVADEMKKRFDELVEKAFNTGAFDWDEAFRNGYVIPKAIVGAVAETVMDECSNYDAWVINERNNIHYFL